MLKTTEAYMQGYRAGEMDGKSDLQTQLDEANARLAMLSEALGGFENECVTRPYDGGWNVDVFAIELWMGKRSEALNATKEHVEAWKEALGIESYKRGAAAATAAHYEQLATVTRERDALREALNRIKKEIPLAAILTQDKSQYRQTTWNFIHEIIEKALAQKGGEAPVMKHTDGSYSFVAIEDYKGDGSPDLALKDDIGAITAGTDYCHSGREMKGGN